MHGTPVADALELEAALASGQPADVLVPCDIGGMQDVARRLREHATVLELAGAALGRVEVTNWRGRAADGFTDVLEPEPARWRTAADGFAAGAEALDGYLGCIGPARMTAADAMTLWQRYLVAAAAAAAVAGLEPTPAAGPRAQVGVLLARQQQAAATRPTAAVLSAEADALRRRAVETLASARQLVLSAGDIAAVALAHAAESAPQARRFWDATIRPADAVGVAHSGLDALGMVPALGAVPDGVNASWYALSGDGTNAVVSVAAMLPLFGDAALASRIARNLAIRPARLTNELANPVPEVLFIAGGRNNRNMTPRPVDTTGLSTFDDVGARIFAPNARVQPVANGETERFARLRT